MKPNQYFLLIAITTCVLFQSCRTEKPAFEISTDEFIVPEGFTIEAIAAEPLLDSPLALSFDEKGRIWVVELPGYMRDIDGSDENKADGRIVVLTDKNGDGIMDEREVIMNDLVAPRTLLNCYGGLLYSNGTSLWFAKLDDKKVVEQTLVDSLYVVGGNIEHQPNNLFYHIDNWIYSANSNARYRFKNGKWLREATLFRGQWGMTADDDGHLYYNNNSLPIATDYSMPNELIKNPYQKVKYSYSQAIATSKQLFPYQATAVNRGYMKGVLDSTGKVKEFTSACSPLIYNGYLFPSEYQDYQNAFVCAPEANLIKRYLLKNEDGKKVAVPAYDSTDFLISKDETFRPINLYNTPDGSMYILDLRKGVIQHRAYMSSYLREEIEEKGLDSINGLGRIYRLVPTDKKNEKARNLYNLSNEELVKLLSSNKPYEQKFAQQQLVFRQAKEQKEAIEAIAKSVKTNQLYALWTLEGLELLDEKFWLTATKEKYQLHTNVLIRFSEFFPNLEKEQIRYFKEKIYFTGYINAISHRLAQLNSKKSDELLLKIIKNHGNDAITCEFIISGSVGKEEQLLEKIQPIENADSLKNFLKVVIENKKNNAIQTPQLPKKVFKDNRTAGLENYNLYCAACHNSDGKGKENLAPPLLKSEYVGGSKERLIALTLVGLQGPITVNGKRYEMNAAMPGIKNNPALKDKDIADLLSFMRSSFTELDFGEVWISPEDVAKLRAKLNNRDELFTEEELLEF